MTNFSVSNPFVLIVEDSDDDFEFMERAFKEASLNVPIQRCEGGQEALDCLFHTLNGSGENALPALILLDLNMFGLDGRRVLNKIKTHEYLKVIPVVIVTTSADEEDIDRCYHAGANSFIVKPGDMECFIEAVKRLKQYWFDLAALPSVELKR